jgi:hypothetical protein
VDAFDADVLIYAAIPGHPLGQRTAALFSARPGGRAAAPVGVGSVLLLPEVLTKPLKDGAADAVRTLSSFLARYNLRAADAIHLATAVAMGAHRFITNNSRDFGAPIKEIDVTFPADLPL